MMIKHSSIWTQTLSIALVLAAALLLASCQGKSSVWEVYVRVLDAADSNAIPGATIESLAGETYQSGPNGAFRWETGLETLAITISATGYQTTHATLSKPQQASELPTVPEEFSLEREMLSGTVVDAVSGEVIPAAQIAFEGETLQSDAQGGFVVWRLALSKLSVTATGYLTAELPLTSMTELASSGSNLQIEMTPRAVSGRVIDGDTGEGLAGAQVIAGNQVTVTTDTGAYQLLYMEPGLDIQVDMPGYRPLAPQHYDGQEHMELELTPWHVLIEVTDEEQASPLAGASILAGDVVAATDTSGQAQLDIEPPQSIDVSAEGYLPQEVAFTGQEQIAVALAPAQATVSYSDADTGLPLAHARILVQAPDNPTSLAHTDDQGEITLRAPADGTSLTLKAPGYVVTTTPIALGEDVAIQATPFEARGIYMPFALLTRADRIEEIIELVDTTELNTIVVDVKGDHAYLAWPSVQPWAQEIEAFVAGVMELPEFVELCHDHGIYVIARMVVFKDNILATEHPELAVMTTTGTFYEDYAELRWVDPSRPEVRSYNVALAQEVAQMGFDEIQFDYVRFPSEGPLSIVRVYSEEDTPEMRVSSITSFCQEAAQALELTPMFISADIFGLNVWVNPPRDNNVGQIMEELAPYMDYFSPMLYPATFWKGNLGFDDPSAFPYTLIYKSVLKAQERTSVLVRPWLQYYWYEDIDLLKQRRGAEDAESSGWLFWNAKARYDAELFAPDTYDRYEAQLKAAILAEEEAEKKTE